jgi:hypothetical protein
VCGRASIAFSLRREGLGARSSKGGYWRIGGSEVAAGPDVDIRPAETRASMPTAGFNETEGKGNNPTETSTQHFQGIEKTLFSDRTNSGEVRSE